MQHAIVVQADDLQQLVESAVTNALIKVARDKATSSNHTKAEVSDYLTTGQTCNYLHCSRPYLYKLKQEGKIKIYKVGLNNLFRRSELDDYVRSLA